MVLSRRGRDFAYVGTLGERAIAQVRAQVGEGKMVCGLLRKDEGEHVVRLFRDHYNIPLVRADASKQFLDALAGTIDPEKSARRGALFIDVLEAEAKKTALSRRKATLDAANGVSDPVQLLFDAGVARHGRQGGQQVLEIADEGHVVEVSPVGETAFNDRPQQSGQGVPVTALVDDHDRLGVQAQCAPGQDLEELLEGADAARQDHEGVGALEHFVLALVHRLDHHGLGERRMARLATHQEAGDDADRLAARLQRGVGQHAHQADAAPAIDQGYALARQQLAQPRGRVAGGGAGAKAGAAENTKGGGYGLGQEGFFICRGSEFPDRDAMVSFGDGKARRQ